MPSVDPICSQLHPVEFGSAMLIGTKTENSRSDATSSDSSDLTAIQLFTADRQPHRFVAMGAQHQTIKEHGLVRVHHLPESGRILSVEPLDIPEPTEPTEPADPAKPAEPIDRDQVAAEMARAKEAEDWFAFRVLERRLKLDELAEDEAGFTGYASAPQVVGRWSDGGSVRVTFADGGVAVAEVDGVARTGTWSMPTDGRLQTDVLEAKKPYRAFFVNDKLALRAGFKHVLLQRVE